jgi:hypothetical protein
METQDARTRTITGLMELNERRCGSIAEATEMLHRVMKAVSTTGKKGKVTLEFEITKDKNDELALMITCTPKCTAPTPDRKKAVVYHDPDHLAFTKTDPRQLELLAEAEAERLEREADLKDANVARIGRGTAQAAE